MEDVVGTMGIGEDLDLTDTRNHKFDHLLIQIQEKESIHRIRDSFRLKPWYLVRWAPSTPSYHSSQARYRSYPG